MNKDDEKERELHNERQRKRNAENNELKNNEMNISVALMLRRANK
jgi:hypothetical protein